MKENHNNWQSASNQLPKLCGADIELGNFILGVERQFGTGYEASRALLREIEGLPRIERFRGEPCDCAACAASRRSGASASTRNRRWSGGIVQTVNLQDWGRKYLPANGGCAYIDLDHLELCVPEVLSARDHVAAWHAMLRIARGALQAANEKLTGGQKICVLVNNSDGEGNSYGSHLNFLVSREAWNNLFRRKIHHMLFLAAFQASSIVFTGQGKVGSENGRPSVHFQISQRADFIEQLAGAHTTHNRPLVNSRDEPLCGGPLRSTDDATRNMARLHVIFYDNTLCHAATLLKVGVMQIVLSMIEAEQLNMELLLDDPVDAVVRWSHDPTLEKRVALTSGEQVTAVELQFRFLAEAKRFAADGTCDRFVPGASEVLQLWEDTLVKLAEKDFASLARRLDWVLKLSILEEVLTQRPDLTWDSPEIKHLDHIYSSLDDAEGLYWAFERSGLTEMVIEDERITHFVSNPPADTRAWTRAMLMRAAGEDSVDDVNWDFVRLKMPRKRYQSMYRRLEMANPLAFNQDGAEPLFRRARTLDELLDALESAEDEAMPQVDGADQTDAACASESEIRSEAN